MRKFSSLRAFMLVAVIAVATLVNAVDAQRVVEETFERLKNSNEEQLVVFYRSSNQPHMELLRTIEKVAEALQSQRPGFQVKKCDGDAPYNVEEFKSAGFDQEFYIFTTTPVAGIEKYTGPRDADSIVFHVRSKFFSYNESDVREFEDELDLWELFDDTGRPLFIKFHEQWCGHCKRLKPTFNRAATYFKGKVDFAEVECSKTERTKEMCKRYDVTGFPVLMLVHGDRSKVRFTEEERSIGAFERWFKKMVSNYGEATPKPKKPAAPKAADDTDASAKKTKGKKTKADEEVVTEQKKPASSSASGGEGSVDAKALREVLERVKTLEAELETVKLELGKQQKKTRALQQQLEDALEDEEDEDDEDDEEEEEEVKPKAKSGKKPAPPPPPAKKRKTSKEDL